MNSPSSRAKCLFVCTHHPRLTRVKGGGVLLSEANLELLEEQFQVISMASMSEFDRTFFGKVIRLMLALFGYWGGNSPWFTKRFQKIVSIEKPDLIFFDYNVLGVLAKVAKRIRPNVKTIMHVHNVEITYYEALYRHHPIWRQISRRAVSKSEVRAFANADEVIVLTLDDGKQLEQIYNLPNFEVIPLGTRGENVRSPLTVQVRVSPKELLFCGSNFPPNVEALIWFVENVLDHIPQSLTVVGFGMENLKQKLKHPKLQIVGTVDSVLPYYERSCAVISPIWSGSGMNAKAIEAIKFGKRLVASEFGLRGFPTPYCKGIVSCQNAGEFIKSLNSMNSPSDVESKEISSYFEMHFSQESRRKKFKLVINRIGF